ncbi:TetR/AcrR family transcriptional regulator [Streptomyces sp. Je 1-4]|uniref:TetR/AcrR family transcriptional regulator n=1 Tax=Streptomyces TaxID=1883 RepID=UPI00140F09E1|nr:MULTISPECIES: TetR/AcrR family transcriptional regulator [unclassified Streptomyces]QIK11084.1 TetR/AcrR family transcriptional regulator [Streptomyces sp. ID38640]UYB44666.1 TetR/AcrR family transcriptional regulator [Streptomyces sp. Je 1-4]UZQ34753.1 TetR/AcrR family transcriptional regulator [Streptomyces sp. Je 1-4] [Streptomyces sp. Je 1-4 4N24]UZQ42171.1 TetR/AcrR family transcriptional regulator [Streptomyces sp. Je 1-4] [Streptomyces sp. Je 1-4 4N24_ara]
MAVARTPRHKWIDEGLRALAAGGPDAVQIEALAKALGVSKGGFYGYFSDRRALLEEMLDRWEREITDDVEARVEKEGGDAKARLRHLFAIVDTGDGLDSAITTDLAIRDWARHDPAVAERLRRVDNRHMDYLRSLFRAFCADEDDVEARCLITFSLYIADRFVLADHGDRSRADVHELTTRWLLDSPRRPDGSTEHR